MTKPKTNWTEPSWDTCLDVLDHVSVPTKGTNWKPWGDHLKPGDVVWELAFVTGYSYGTVCNALKTLESYGMLTIERLSHDYPCQHNFICWVRRRGESNWTVEPYQAWSQTGVRTPHLNQQNPPALTILQGGLAS